MARIALTKTDIRSKALSASGCIVVASTGTPYISKAFKTLDARRTSVEPVGISLVNNSTTVSTCIFADACKLRENPEYLEHFVTLATSFKVVTILSFFTE